ncbi:hypothetical protein DFH08DRAFT_959752 [Mycena albidolilacea]|uniref:Uncharacterized protein n=1 Tax=Mycena albidolilacea TaxID=1033008 RepID=A0AAD7A2M9_9AGAR|nr:hypothetical protein DFH08DRAFT_959752 [Mycena albidolilacea]
MLGLCAEQGGYNGFANTKNVNIWIHVPSAGLYTKPSELTARVSNKSTYTKNAVSCVSLAVIVDIHYRIPSLACLVEPDLLAVGLSADALPFLYGPPVRQHFPLHSHLRPTAPPPPPASTPRRSLSIWRRAHTRLERPYTHDRSPRRPPRSSMSRWAAYLVWSSTHLRRAPAPPLARLRTSSESEGRGTTISAAHNPRALPPKEPRPLPIHVPDELQVSHEIDALPATRR